MAEQSGALKKMDKRNFHHPKAVLDASGQVDRRRFLKIFSRAGHFGNLETGINNLGEHFIVENEIIRIGFKGNGAKHLATESPVARMVFREFIIDQYILEQREEAVCPIFVDRHASAQGAFSQDPASQHHGVEIIADDIDHAGDEEWRVLVIRMQHDDNIRVDFKGLLVQRFLIAPISFVLFVADDMVDAEVTGFFNGIVAAGIIAQNDFVHEASGNFLIRFGQGAGSIIGWQDDHNFFILVHDAKIDGMCKMVQMYGSGKIKSLRFAAEAFVFL